MILIVEDDSVVRDVACTALRTLGYKVTSAKNGIQALEKLRKMSKDIDLLITDIVMPEMGGMELARKMRDSFPQIKVLFTTGYPDYHLKHQELLLENINFLRKPYSLESLSRFVSRSLKDA